MLIGVAPRFVVLTVLASLLSSVEKVNAQSKEKFACYGTYSNIEEAPVSRDPSGLEIVIRSPKKVDAIVAEGGLVGTSATDIKIAGNEISFSYFGNTFLGECTKRGIFHHEYDYETGKTNRVLLRPFSFTTERRWGVEWNPD